MSIDERSPGDGPPRLRRAPAGPPRPGEPGGAEITAVAALAAGLPCRGDLASDGPIRLHYLAAASSASGRLTLRNDRGRHVLHLKRGVVEHAASDLPEDDLGRFLVARGSITAEALADAQRVRDHFAGDLVSALASLGLMNPAESYRTLQEHGAAVLAHAIAVDGGAWEWEPDAVPPPSSFPLGSRWGLLSEAVRRLDGLAVRKLLGDRARRVATRSRGRVEAAELRLTAHEARAATLFDGRTSPAQLAERFPADAETVLRTALLLGGTELLAFGELASPAAATTAGATPAAPVRATQPPAPARTTQPPAAAPGTQPPKPARTTQPPAAAPARQTQPPAAARPDRITTVPPVPPSDPAALRAHLERLATLDHFEALGVAREASGAQIKAAYFRLAKTYHPDAGPPSEDPGTRKLRADVFARLGEAWGVLGDDARRTDYLLQLASGGAGQVDASAIFKAEELFRRATILVGNRQYDAARAALVEARGLNPDEPEFEVWTAWVDFLLARDHARQQAESAAVIEAALKKVPRCIPGYRFLALMAKANGDLAAAERHLKRGLSLEPDHAELARELKYLRK